MMQRLIFSLGTWFLVLGTSHVIAQPSDGATVAAFVKNYCVSCHNGQLKEGDRRFDQLLTRKIGAEELELWHEILDRMNLADMPPEDAPRQPKEQERVDVANKLTGLLSKIQSVNDSGPSTVFRRLNRKEYDRTMREILALDSMVTDPTVDFPPDETKDHFRNIGETLVLSDVLLAQYLDASREYLDHAMAKASAQPVSIDRTFEAPFCRSMPNPDGQDRPGQYQHLRENPTEKFGYLWLRKLPRGVPASGWYQVRVKAEAIQRDYPHDASIIGVPREDPLQLAIVASDTGAGDMLTNNATDKTLATFELADNDPRWYETTVWLDAGYTPRMAYPNGPAKIKYMRSRLFRRHRDQFPKFIRDRIHVFFPMHPDYDRVEGPKLAKQFLDEQDRLKKAGKPYDLFGLAHRSHTDAAWIDFYNEYQGPRVRVHQVELAGPLDRTTDRERLVAGFFPGEEPTDQQAEQLIAQFAQRALRGPVDPAFNTRIGKLYQDQLRGGNSYRNALRIAYQAILCSPQFLYHRTDHGPLDDYQLASRLSYLVWSSAPDERLLASARAGILGQPAELRRQLNRLLDDPRSNALVENLAGAWLKLDKLGTMLPSRDEHPGYFNEQLEHSMRAETEAFLADAIDRNLGVSVFVDSDYSFLNAPLARLYGVEGVSGFEMQRTRLGDRRRGGLLGQASVLTASANGIDTSPVLRGVWVMESLLGAPPPPPPPDVEPIEPDTRGTTTIREQLDAHRNVATCANCHRRIDPPGFALESFDEIGRFRDRYAVRGKPNAKGPAVDPSGQLPSGESFAGIVELKQHLANRLDFVSRNYARHLLTLATGRIDDVEDRAELLQLVGQVSASSPNRSDPLQPHGAGARDLLHAIVQSDSFRR